MAADPGEMSMVIDQTKLSTMREMVRTCQVMVNVVIDKDNAEWRPFLKMDKVLDLIHAAEDKAREDSRTDFDKRADKYTQQSPGDGPSGVSRHD